MRKGLKYVLVVFMMLVITCAVVAPSRAAADYSKIGIKAGA